MPPCIMTKSLTGLKIYLGIGLPIPSLPDVPVVGSCLGTVIILRVVDEHPSFSLNEASLKVVDDPKAVVEETLVVVVEIVVQGLPIVVSAVLITCLSLRVCPHIRKPGLVVVDEPGVGGVGGRGVSDAEHQLTVCCSVCVLGHQVWKILDKELGVESIGLPPLSRKRLGGGEDKEEKEEH